MWEMLEALYMDEGRALQKSVGSPSLFVYLFLIKQ